jgi:hypothetical protein
MAYKLGATTVVDDAALIPWARISGAPTIPGAADILASVAAAAYGAVGTHLFAYRYGTGITEGSIYAGSELFPAGHEYIDSTSSNGADQLLSGTALTRGASALSGSWRAMGRVRSNNAPSTNRSRYTLFLRIS